MLPALVAVGGGSIEIQCPKIPGITEKKEVQLSVRPEKIRFIESSWDTPVKVEGVIEELTRIRILVSHTDAAERAGRCAEHARLKDAVLDGAELLIRHLLSGAFY